MLSFLEPRDLLRAAQTCHYWRILCEDNLLWKEKCREAGIDEMNGKQTRRRSQSGVPRSPWKSMYIRQHQIEYNWRFAEIRPHKVCQVISLNLQGEHDIWKLCNCFIIHGLIFTLNHKDNFVWLLRAHTYLPGYSLAEESLAKLGWQNHTAFCSFCNF